MKKARLGMKAFGSREVALPVEMWLSCLLDL